MGEIRFIIDWLAYPPDDDFEKNEDFEKAIRTLMGTTGALISLKDRIPDLDDEEKKIIVTSINNNRLRVVHTYINWVDFVLRDKSLSEEERKTRAHKVIGDMRKYIKTRDQRFTL